jgi:hypothetical protein
MDTCVKTCPPNYTPDDVNRICSFDTNLLNHTIAPVDKSYGCMDGLYWDMKT